MLSLTMKSNIILLLSVLCGSLSVMGNNADSVSVRCPLGVSDATVNAGLRGTYVMPTNHLLRGIILEVVECQPGWLLLWNSQ